MPSTRRVKVLAIALAIAVCTFFYLSNDSSSQEFYTRTVAALDKKQYSNHETMKQSQDMKDATRGQEPVLVQTPDKALFDYQEPLEAHVSASFEGSDKSKADQGEGKETGKSVAGRKTMKTEEAKNVYNENGASEKLDSASGKSLYVTKEGKEDELERKEDHEIETELNSILKKGPIIVFSKSYCPFSTKAKHILLKKYTIVPAPYVVELDTHPFGVGLQKHLEKSTGRRTVPNVLINGKSIGGGDDIEALDNGGNLVETVTSMGGKRITEAKLTQSR